MGRGAAGVPRVVPERHRPHQPPVRRYAIVIGDARSLTIGTAAGNTTTEYDVTIDQLAR